MHNPLIRQCKLGYALKVNKIGAMNKLLAIRVIIADYISHPMKGFIVVYISNTELSESSGIVNADKLVIIFHPNPFVFNIIILKVRTRACGMFCFATIFKENIVDCDIAIKVFTIYSMDIAVP